MFHFLLIAFSVLLSLSSNAYAVTYWVAKTGSDSRSCIQAQSQSTPKLTISSGLTCLSAGDTLMVRGGNYAERVEGFEASGTNFGSGAITVRAADGETVWVGRINITPNQDRKPLWVIVDRINVDGNLGPDNGVGVYISAERVRLKDMEVKNSASTGINMTGACASNNEFINLNVHHHDCRATYGGPCGQSFYICGDNHLIDGGEFHHNGHDGIQFRKGDGGGPNNNVVRNAKIYSNVVAGLEFHTGGSGNVAYNNIMYNNGDMGYWDAANGTKVYNNTFYGNGAAGITCAPGQSSGIIVRNNIFWNNGSPTETCTGTLSNNLTSNPIFANPAEGDFHLTGTSTNAIDQGATLGDQYAVDKDGVTRPKGAGYDIGAYEFLLSPILLAAPTNFRSVAN